MKTALLLLAALVLSEARVEAFPNYAVLYKSTFSYLPSCMACHEQESWENNEFGKQFLAGGRSLKAFEAIKDKDADGDGAANLAEILAKANPGDPHSTPVKPGKWLAAAKIKAPQKLLRQGFPDADRFEVKEIQLSDPTLPDESRYSVVFPAISGAATLGAGAYVSVDLPGKKKPTLLFVEGDRQGRLQFLKVIEYEGTKALAKQKWTHLIGKDADAIANDASVKGPEKEIDLFKGAIIRALKVVKLSLE